MVEGVAVGEAVTVGEPVSSVAVPVVPEMENCGVKLKLSGSLSSMIWMV